MFKRNKMALGIKITAGLLVFLVVLGVATIWLVTRGFNQAERTAVGHSAESLENQSKANLIQLTQLEARLYNAALVKAANLTQVAAAYVVNTHAGGHIIDWKNSARHVIWSSAQLTRSPDGLLYYDASPDRQTEVLHPGNIRPDSQTDELLQDSAILDELFPSLLPQAETGVGIYFQGPQLTFRYYPVRNLPQVEIDNGAAEAAQNMHIEDFPVAPRDNPDRRTIWLPPYVDDAGQGLLVSANTPIYYGDEFQGFVGIDISLARLIDQLNSLKPTPTSFAFLMDAQGRLIAAPPDGAAVLAGRRLSTQESSPTGVLGLPLDENNAQLAPVLSAARGGLTGATQLDLGGETMLVTYAPLANQGWNLSIVVPLSEVIAESKAASQAIRSDELVTVRNTLLAMGFFFLVAMIASLWLSQRFLNRPLRQLLQGVREITSGSQGVSVPVNSQDELGELASSFNQMAEELNQRTQQLTQTNYELQIKKAEVKVAALEERQRLARELHDSVSQALYGIALGSRTARTLLERDDPAKAAEPLDYVLSLAEAGLSEMRALIFELRPESLKNEGLVVALTKQSDALQARHKLDVVTSFCPEPDISLDAKEALYRVAQEAMHNIARHAKATRIELSLLNKDGVITLEVRDNGKGFDPNGDFPGHLGLKSMRERVANIGGAFHITSQPGEGTVLTVHVTL